MNTLHIIRSSAFSSNDLQQALSLASENDRIVLTDDGVYNLNHPLLNKHTPHTIYCVEQHLIARGINDNLAAATLISMAQLVELTLTHKPVITWQ